MIYDMYMLSSLSMATSSSMKANSLMYAVICILAPRLLFDT